MIDREGSGTDAQLELQKILEEIGETHDFSSWPYGRELAIEDWVLAGDENAKPPFDDRQKIVTPAFFHRLGELRLLCDGWFYYEDVFSFYAREAWLIKRREIESERERIRQKEILRIARIKRLDEIVLQARLDSEFWIRAKEHLREFWRNILNRQSTEPLHEVKIVSMRALSNDEIQDLNSKRVPDLVLRDFCEAAVRDNDIVDYWDVQGGISSAIFLELYSEGKLQLPAR